MQIRVLAVGKCTDSYYRDGCEDYLKRLNRLIKTELVEVADEKAPESLSAAQQKQVMAKEGEKLKKQLRPGKTVALVIGGTMPNSLSFAEKLRTWEDSGVSSAQFIIGGSLGLDETLISQADETLSLSRFTMPHSLARLVLLEQLYRAMKINRNQTYHK
ncbi:MAG: 23S rRNA (pseudouridine(1915)-N(3))-methyltransferase RlmH [Clostridia bacterium]|nr:23S rRNA (pseudouridine(1915)-N(3))-methyltransferase RlmH [Clostridia bacterium]